MKYKEKILNRQNISKKKKKEKQSKIGMATIDISNTYT